MPSRAVPDKRLQSGRANALADDDLAVGGGGPSHAEEFATGKIAKALHSTGRGPAKRFRAGALFDWPTMTWPSAGNCSGLAVKFATGEVAEPDHSARGSPAECLDALVAAGDANNDGTVGRDSPSRAGLVAGRPQIAEADHARLLGPAERLIAVCGA